jgi:hypothetical protein
VKRAAGVLLACLLAAPVVAQAQSDSVTLSIGQYRNVNKVLVLVFRGAVSSGAAGEEVEVVGRDCGQQGYRLISGAKTRAGGGWQVENPSVDPPRWTPVDSGMTFRARWRSHVSEPVVWRAPAPIFALQVPGRRAWKVSVNAYPGRASLKGHVVEVQRRVEGRWVRFRRGPLVHKPSFDLGAFNYEAVFPIAARGLRLRAYIPARSALPCYLPAATPSWRS